MARYEDTGQENRQGPGYQLAPGLKAPPYEERRLQSGEGGFEAGAAQAADMDYQEAEELGVEPNTKRVESGSRIRGFSGLGEAGSPIGAGAELGEVPHVDMREPRQR